MVLTIFLGKADIRLEEDTIVSYSLKSLEYLKAIEKKDKGETFDYFFYLQDLG